MYFFLSGYCSRYSLFFNEHSQFTGQQRKEEATSLTPLCHSHPLQRHLDIGHVITAESSLLHIASSQTQIGPFGMTWIVLKTRTKYIITSLPAMRDLLLLNIQVTNQSIEVRYIAARFWKRTLRTLFLFKAKLQPKLLKVNGKVKIFLGRYWKELAKNLIYLNLVFAVTVLWFFYYY